MTTEFTPKQAHDLAVRTLLAAGVTSDDAEIVASHLVRAEQRGYPSHGLVRLPSISDALDQSAPAGQRTLISDKPGFIMFDGARSQGIAAVTQALAFARARCSTTGATVAAVTNYVGTTGCMGVYGADLAETGHACILLCHSEFAVAPVGSAKPILGTNPIAFAMPTATFPFVGDVATSAWSYGSLKTAMREGRSIPEGIVQTADGQPSTDPNDADNGSQLPMSGHKGYALGLGIELLCGPLLGGKAGHDAVAGSDSLIAVVIKCDVARSKQAVIDDVERLVQEIKSSPVAKGHEQIRIPGERAHHQEESSTSIKISDAVLASIEALCQ